MRKSPPTIDSILRRRSTGLGGVLGHVHELQRIGAAIRRALPNSLAAHTELANVRDQTLILNADSPAWASRLRYQSKVLIRQLQVDTGLDIRDVRIKVSPREYLRDPIEPARRPQGAPRRHILQAAEEVDDSALAASLRRLAGVEENHDGSSTPEE